MVTLTYTMGIRMNIWKVLVMPKAINQNGLHEQTQKHFPDLKEPSEEFMELYYF